MRARLLACAILAGTVALPATAAPTQTPPPEMKVDPASMAAADRLLTAMGYDEMMKNACDAMVAKMAPVLKASIEQETGKSIDDALVQRLTAVETQFLQEMLVNSPNVRRATALIYARHFTAGELGHMADLYKDPVMRKWSQVAPEAGAEMLPLVHKLLEGHQTELQDRIKSAMIEYYSDKNDKPDS